MADRLLIIGASGRAAASSSLRAGLSPFVIDLFNDADTCILAECLRCPLEDYPWGFVELAKRAPPGPWMYTGGLENYPEVVAAISQTRPLWGNAPEVLAYARDPFQLLDAGVSMNMPEIRRCDGKSNTSPGSHWLRKPFRGAGGLGIRFAKDDEPASADHYLQEFVPGTPLSALFLFHSIVGVSKQLVGTRWLHAPTPFSYAGNIGPYPIKENHYFDSPRIGWANSIWLAYASLAMHGTNIRGINGADFVIDKRINWRLVDLNPRYPASAELYELASGQTFPALQFHRSMFDKSCEPPDCAYGGNWTTLIGKAIYYAAVPLVFPAGGPWLDSLATCTEVWNIPDFADIPHPGTHIEAGQPILTFFATGTDEDEVIEKMKRRAAELHSLLGQPIPLTAVEDAK